MSNPKDTLFGEAESADELLALFAGAASVCWSDIGGAGVFESERASALVDAALDRLVELGWFGPRAVTGGTDASPEEPIEVGWYAYSGGRQSMMIFHLRETGQWSVHLDNGTAADCAWSYIEQALGVWDLVRIDLPGGTDG